jgi:hypothetical protein
MLGWKRNDERNNLLSLIGVFRVHSMFSLQCRLLTRWHKVVIITTTLTEGANQRV